MDMHSSGNRGQSTIVEFKERRRSEPVDSEEIPRRRFNDSKFNQLKWPLFVLSWFLAGMAIVFLFVTT